MNPYFKVAFHTLGCKLNFSETSTIARLFENEGFAKVDFFDVPDIYVINTCSVTNNADKETKRLVRKALKVNPEAFVAIIGCYAQLKPEEISEIPGVDLVLGANEKFNLHKYVGDLKKKDRAEIMSSEIKEVKEFIPAFSTGDRTRTFLKVQDGCDYFCSFCTIPLARGFSRSANIEETIKIAEKASGSGALEVVLTGVNLGDFGKNSNENFYQLMQELELVQGIRRYRISSIEPNLLSDEIIHHVSESELFAPHFHIPLQSGSDKILQLMRRRYLTDHYASRIRLIKETMPFACIGADVIVGYPGENDEDFQETYDFISSLPISYLHVFTYSERDNTVAVRRSENIVPASTRAERSKKLHILSDKLKRAFYLQNLERSGKVLFEGKDEDGFMYGFTENYIKVKSEFNPDYVNTIHHVQYLEMTPSCEMKVKVLEYQTLEN